MIGVCACEKNAVFQIRVLVCLGFEEEDGDCG